MIMDMCILSNKTHCFLMFGHVVGVGVGKLRGLPVMLRIKCNVGLFHVMLRFVLFCYVCNVV